MKKDGCIKYLPYILLGTYLIVILWITILNREHSDKPPMLTPFWEYVRVIRNQSRKYYIRQIVCNIALFIPFGFLFAALPPSIETSNSVGYLYAVYVFQRLLK